MTQHQIIALAVEFNGDDGTPSSWDWSDAFGLAGDVLVLDASDPIAGELPTLRQVTEPHLALAGAVALLDYASTIQADTLDSVYEALRGPNAARFLGLVYADGEDAGEELLTWFTEQMVLRLPGEVMVAAEDRSMSTDPLVPAAVFNGAGYDLTQANPLQHVATPPGYEFVASDSD